MNNDANRFQGWNQVLLNEYFQNKIRLSELQNQIMFNNSEELKKEINKIEKDIRIFISSLDPSQLRQLIYMSLNLDSIYSEPNLYEYSR